MSDQIPNPESPSPDPKSRAIGTTEQSWCKAVPTGTGITVLSLLLSKPPNLPILQNALHSLQIHHPILLSKLNPTTFTPTTTPVQISSVDHLPSFHSVLENELNTNPWLDHSTDTDGHDVMFATVYRIGDSRWTVAIRVHTAACDRAAAAELLRELIGLLSGIGLENGEDGKVNLGIENYVPNGKGNKAFWARGVDMLGYSLNSLRLSNLEFMDHAALPRSSRVVRLQLSSRDTGALLNECKSRGIKLCGALGAAALISARCLKGLPDQQWEKYAVVTLVDCRSMLDPPLSSHHFGFYHSAILNTHDIKGGENLWDLALRTYTSFANAKKQDKHFSDMADMNFLMCKALDNPGLTPSSSLRTSLISVFEDAIIDHANEKHQEIGLEDYVGCASIHGVGPSIAVFDTIRDGMLDCACVYPFPLHSMEQMQELVDCMKKILVGGCNTVETDC